MPNSKLSPGPRLDEIVDEIFRKLFLACLAATELEGVVLEEI
jgi:hypothetical protein